MPTHSSAPTHATPGNSTWTRPGSSTSHSNSRSRPPGSSTQVNDEAWALLSDEASARWLQATTKLSRALSLSVVNDLHRISDTAAAGNADSTTRLGRGRGLWVVNGEQRTTHLVDHLLAPDERALVDTDTMTATHEPDEATL